MACTSASTMKALRQRGCGALGESRPCGCENFKLLAVLTIGLMYNLIPRDKCYNLHKLYAIYVVTIIAPNSRYSIRNNALCPAGMRELNLAPSPLPWGEGRGLQSQTKTADSTPAVSVYS